MKKTLFWLLVLVLSPIAVLVVITPMDSQKQYIFGLLSIGILFVMGFSKNRSVSVIMVVTSLLMSTRYMYFRLTQTLHFNSTIEAILGMGLFLAEVYIWVMLLLNYLQTVWPLKREIVPLPDDMSKWPTVDIYIPSYNEPLEVVRDTVLAAQCIDYPKDKLKIYLLDDGKRNEFAVFAADVGVGYITRNDNKHAKAGNLNHAMTLTNGELICVFDCDHVATRVFLQATVGGFLNDPMLALVQTPHRAGADRRLCGRDRDRRCPYRAEVPAPGLEVGVPGYSSGGRLSHRTSGGARDSAYPLGARDDANIPSG